MDNFQSLQNKLPSSADTDETSESLPLCSAPREKNSMNHIDHTTNLYNYYFAPDKVRDIVLTRRILNRTPTHVTRRDLMRNQNKDNLFPLSNISDHKADRDKYYTHFFPPCSVSVCQKETDTSRECTTQKQSMKLPFTNKIVTKRILEQLPTLILFIRNKSITIQPLQHLELEK